MLISIPGSVDCQAGSKSVLSEIPGRAKKRFATGGGSAQIAGIAQEAGEFAPLYRGAPEDPRE